MIKDTDEHPDGRDAWGKECGKGAELPCSLRMPLYLNLREFTNPEVLQTPSFWVFIEASLHRRG